MTKLIDWSAPWKKLKALIGLKDKDAKPCPNPKR